MQHTNIFTPSDVAYILALPDVVAAQGRLETTSQVYFTIQLTDTIRNAIQTRLGLDMSSISEIPMRWIQGDMAPHVDVGSTRFENTYLVYMNDSPGELRIDTSFYPITSNTAFVFNEGVSHETRNTNGTPRLLVGPMNEQGMAVGLEIPGGPPGGPPGEPPACFVDGTRILTNNGYKAVETLLYKDLVVTSDGRTVDYVLNTMKIPVTNTSSAPYRIEAGAFGKNKPEMDICLSPSHKIQLRKGVWISPERAAKVNDKVKQYDVGKPVTYWHIECADYLKDNLICEGMVSESYGSYKNYKGPSKLYTWSERLGGFTRPSSSVAAKLIKKE